MEHVITNAQTGERTFTPFTADEIAFAQIAARPTQADYSRAIQAIVDQTAQARQYENGVSLAGYVNSTVSAWAAEAAAFIAWRDSVWAYAYTQLALVQNGTRTQPSVATLLAELPAITWP